MKTVQKMCAGIAAAVLCSVALHMTVLADRVITRVSLSVEADLKVGDECRNRDIVITPQSEDYEVRELEILNETDKWGPSDLPRVAVYLKALDGNSFSLQRANVRLKGAEIESVEKWNYNDDECRLVLRLPSLRKQVGEISEVRWDSLTVCSWSEAYNAVYYELRLYKDGRATGAAQTVSGSSFDFGSYMRSEGSYRCRVRAINAVDHQIKSPWAESGVSVVDAAAAAGISQQYESPIPQGMTGPGQWAEMQAQAYKDIYGWIREGDRWWYRNQDGSYTVSNWQLIDEKWYFFDSKGYMVTGWIDWNGKSYYCDPESGEMLVSTVVPDGLGRRVDSTGAMIE